MVKCVSHDEIAQYISADYILSIRQECVNNVINLIFKQDWLDELPYFLFSPLNNTRYIFICNYVQLFATARVFRALICVFVFVFVFNLWLMPDIGYWKAVAEQPFKNVLF